MHFCQLQRNLSIAFGTPWSAFTPLYFILVSSFTFCYPLGYPAPAIFVSPHMLVALLLSLEYIILPSKLHSDLQLANISILPWLDITNRANWHYNSMSPTRQTQITRSYMEHLQRLCAIDELCIPTRVGPDVMGDWFDDIYSMSDWYHFIAELGCCFSVSSLMF